MTFVKFKETYNVKTNFLSYQSAISAIKGVGLRYGRQL